MVWVKLYMRRGSRHECGRSARLLPVGSDGCWQKKKKGSINDMNAMDRCVLC